ncbi:ribosomal protein S18-alanine N-acetyltransferase [Shewanella marina]|uniref:ribosomal protein S18-alanine N-acetyltransferase n=1 Tax=Shewanella marina TaxID=487319 RepID=UPI00046E91F3|nr:ribosomal protein S18-alanine N-acetyltransferase [Shewanella marina]
MIELLTQAQAPAMAKIAIAAHSHPMSLASIESCFGRFYSCFGAYQEEVLVGFVIVHQLFEESSIIDICVDPSAQGQHIGQTLMDYIEAFLLTTEAEQILLEVRQSNSAALALYRKLGFIETGCRKGYYPTDAGVEDAILMQKPIMAH